MNGKISWRESLTKSCLNIPRNIICVWEHIKWPTMDIWSHLVPHATILINSTMGSQLSNLKELSKWSQNKDFMVFKLSAILLMARILHDLGCKNPVNNGHTTNLNWWVYRISEPSTVQMNMFHLDDETWFFLSKKNLDVDLNVLSVSLITNCPPTTLKWFRKSIQLKVPRFFGVLWALHGCFKKLSTKTFPEAIGDITLKPVKLAEASRLGTLDSEDNADWNKNPKMLHGTGISIYLHENHRFKPNAGKYTIHGWRKNDEDPSTFFFNSIHVR